MSMMLASLLGSRRVMHYGADDGGYLAGAAVPTSSKITGIRRSTGVNLRRAKSVADASVLGAGGAAVLEGRRGSTDESPWQSPKHGLAMPRARTLQFKSLVDPAARRMSVHRRSSGDVPPPAAAPRGGGDALPVVGDSRRASGDELLDVGGAPRSRRRSTDELDQEVEPRRSNRRSSTDDATQRRSSQQRMGEEASSASAAPQRTMGRTRTEPQLRRTSDDELEGRGFTPCGTPTQVGSTSPNGVFHSIRKKSSDVAAEARAAQEARAARQREIRDHFTGTKMNGVLNQVFKELDEKRLSHKELFTRLDVSGDGHLSRAEMQYGLRKLGVTLQKEELEAFVTYFDLDGNGVVDFKEFSRLIKQAVDVAAELEDKDRVCGYKIGSTVLLMIKVEGLKDKEEGIVVGPGTQPDTVMVRFGRPGLVAARQSLSLKPTQIRPQKP